MNYQMKAHSVTAQHIEKVEPLIIGGDKMLSPDAGIRLRFEDGTSLRWMIEQGQAAPQVGDFLVTDTELATTFVISAAKFELLFQVA
jgi:hypothetical protein